MTDTTQTGIPIEDCATCGHRHPVTRKHCESCGLAHNFPPCPRTSPTLDEFAAHIAAAKRGEVLPESDAWLAANARTRPDWRDDSAAEDIVRDRIEQRIDVDPRGDDRAADRYFDKRWGMA